MIHLIYITVGYPLSSHVYPTVFSPYQPCSVLLSQSNVARSLVCSLMVLPSVCSITSLVYSLYSDSSNTYTRTLNTNLSYVSLGGECQQ